MLFNILIGLLSISILLNIFVIWYLFKMIPKIIFVSENVEDLSDLIGNYREHLKGVYSLDMFYGDETLQNLLDHTKSLHILLEEYEAVVDLITPKEEIYEEENENERSQLPQEKDVLYAGSRRRDS